MTAIINSVDFLAGISALALAFAQLTYRESLHGIEACLLAVSSKLYHMGFRGKVSKSTLADANEAHDWRIFTDFAQVLIHLAPADVYERRHWNRSGQHPSNALLRATADRAPTTRRTEMLACRS